MTDWTVSFDFEALMRKYHRLFNFIRDLDLWNKWTEEYSFGPQALRDLRTNEEIRDSLRAMAIAATLIPAQFLPFPWRDPESGKPAEIELFHRPSDSDRALDRFFHDCLCSFMEAVPSSPLFDSSDHPIARVRLHSLNLSLLGCLEQCVREAYHLTQQERRRAFDCYRLQGQSWRSHELDKPFGAFAHLMVHTPQDYLPWKTLADEKMRAIVESECRGQGEWAGAFQGYTNCIREWLEQDDECKGYSYGFVADQMEYVLGLDRPWEERVPSDLFGGFAGIFTVTERHESQEKLARHFLVEEPPLTKYNEARSRDWYCLVSLAKGVVMFSTDDELLSAARRYISIEEERTRPTEQALAVADVGKLKRERRQALLAEMKK